jgi:P-aminobenzoate N-oxygenase AurF
MTTAHSAAARRVSSRLDTLWDFDYEPTHHELESLYETAKKNQWNGSTAIDWSRPIGKEGPVLNIAMAFGGTTFFERFTEEEKKEAEIRVSSWRLSQFLHGEQGALMVASQLVAPIPDLDSKKYASTQVVDEGRHVEVFERYVKKLHRIYPVDPLLKGLIDEILASEAWELKLLGMQMLIEGLAIAAFNIMHKQTADPTLRDVLDYVLQDEGRHVNFGYFALRRAVPAMDPGKRAMLEDFALKACDAMYTRDDHTGFQSVKQVWEEMGLDGDEVWRDGIANSPTVKAFNRFLFTEVLIPRLQRLGLISSRVEPRYREIGLLD